MPKVLYPNYFPEYFGNKNCAGITPNPSIYGPQGVYAVGLSLDDAMLLIWRIKKFTLSLPVGLGSSQTTSNATTETDIFCSESTYSVEGDVYYTSPSGDDPIIQAQLSLAYDTPVYRDGDLYYPSLSISYSYSSQTDGGGTTISAIQADSAYVDSPAYTFSLSVGNSGLPPIIMRASIYEGSPPLPSLSVSEYWSYGGTWNTGDGSAL